jgi:hypothetical protein
LSPLSWLFVLGVIVIPAIFWLTARSGDEQRAVLVATRPIPAYSVVGPGDLQVAVRKGVSGELPAELPFTGIVTLRDVAPGATLSRTDVAPVGPPAALPRDPVAVQLGNLGTLPPDTPVGRRVTIYGASGQQPFAVSAILLNKDTGPEHRSVFLLARSDVKDFGTALSAGMAVAIVDVAPR